jgi:hypothetical protein
MIAAYTKPSRIDLAATWQPTLHVAFVNPTYCYDNRSSVLSLKFVELCLTIGVNHKMFLE